MSQTEKSSSTIETLTFDARGNGDGKTVCTLTGGHESTISDYTALVLRRNEQMETEQNNAVVRRLTPLECERLQGFPDGWTDIGDWVDTKGKLHKGSSDANRYKALGNSIALPYWEFLAERMVGVLQAEGNEAPTMASLFDGIGGFPLVFERHGCKAVWASEIEEFPIAVTKFRFKENQHE